MDFVNRKKALRMKNKKLIGIVMVLLLVVVSFGFQRADAKGKKASAPEIKKVQAIANGVKITLNKAQDNDYTYYELFYKKNGDKEWSIEEVYQEGQSSPVSFIVTGLDKGKYTIKIRIKDPDGYGTYSKFSKEKKVTVKKELSDLNINSKNFPNEDIRNVVKEYDLDSDGILSGKEISKIKSIYIFFSDSVVDWQGMNKLKYLEELRVYKLGENDVQVRNFDLKEYSELKSLSVNNILIGKIDLTNNKKLKLLELVGNGLTDINTKQNKYLRVLSCMDNPIKKLDLCNNTELVSLTLSSLEIETIDLKKNTKLHSLDCIDVPIKNLVLSNNTELSSLQLWNLQLETINLKKNTKLKSIDCNCNEIDVSKNVELEKLRCKGLKSKDLTKHIKLSKLLCDDQEKVKRKIEISQSLFPDNNFKKFIEDTYDVDQNGYLTTEEIIDVTDINVDSLGISSLEGIECFSGNLETLSCRDNSLYWIAVYSFNRLKKLDCSGNHYLKQLVCFGCSIEDLNIRDCDGLEKLDCSENMITELDLSGHNKLRSLTAYYNKLTQVDLSECLNIETVQLNGDIQSVVIANEKCRVYGVDEDKIIVVK